MDSNEDNPRFKMRYNDSDIAWQMGIGVDIRKFFLDARYTSYFRDTKNTVRISGVNHKFTVTRNDYWSFHAGFFF